MTFDNNIYYIVYLLKTLCLCGPCTIVLCFAVRIQRKDVRKISRNLSKNVKMRSKGIIWLLIQYIPNEFFFLLLRIFFKAMIHKKLASSIFSYNDNNPVLRTGMFGPMSILGEKKHQQLSKMSQRSSRWGREIRPGFSLFFSIQELKLRMSGGISPQVSVVLSPDEAPHDKEKLLQIQPNIAQIHLRTLTSTCHR